MRLRKRLPTNCSMKVRVIRIAWRRKSRCARNAAIVRASNGCTIACFVISAAPAADIAQPLTPAPAADALNFLQYNPQSDQFFTLAARWLISTSEGDILPLSRLHAGADARASLRNFLSTGNVLDVNCTTRRSHVRVQNNAEPHDHPQVGGSARRQAELRVENRR